MKRYHIDAVLIVLCGCVASAAIFKSATGGDVFLLAIVLACATLLVSSLLIGYRRYTRRPVLPVLLVPFTSLAIITSIATTDWPLRVSYVLSRDAFDELAKQVRIGEQVGPRRVGLFLIRRAEVQSNGVVCLWTDPNPGGNSGFVQCARDYVPFNLWSMVRLDDRWQFISED